jgi:hypothetical protein
MNQNKLPDFLIIGTQKGGTSSLFYYLSQHPNVICPQKKEIHFFDLNYNSGRDWYSNHFEFDFHHPSIFLTGEASPYYLFHPLVPQRVYGTCPNVKLIILLRNPVNRAYSHYMMQKNRSIEKCQTFEEAIQIEPIRLKGEYDKFFKDKSYRSYNYQKFSYLERGQYFTQIENWLKYFPITSFLFLKSEELFADPKSALQKTYSFLNIREVFPKDLSPVNTNKYNPMLKDTRLKLEKYFFESVLELQNTIKISLDWF